MDLFGVDTDVDNKKRYSDATEQLSTLRNGSFLEMGFPPELEQSYQEGQTVWYRDAIRISCLLAVVLLVLSYVVEWSTHIQLTLEPLLARAASILLLLGTFIYAHKSRRMRWKYWVVAVNTLLLVGTLLVIAQQVPQPVKMMYYCNVFFVEVVVFAFIRLPLNFTNTLGLVLLLMVGAAVYVDGMGQDIAAHIMFFMFSGTLISVLVAIKSERMSRKSYIKSELLEHEKRQLRALNDRVNAESGLDRVTRLMNRGAFEDKLMSSWSLSSQEGGVLMLVAIHIEYFAYFNEQRGMECGDDLLREMARKIRVALLDRGDVACRISGGRFVVLLNGSEQLVNQQLETLRDNLSSLVVLERSQVTRDAVYLSWGRVILGPDTDRDPRGLLDRMFKHLVRLDRTPLRCREAI